MPLGVEIVVTETAPVRLPGERWPRTRTHRLSARAGGEFLFVGVRGGTPAPEGFVDIPLDPGDICFYDAERPPSLELLGQVRLKVFLVTREALALPDHALRRVMAAPVSRSSRLGGLLSPFLSELADTVSVSPPAISEMLSWNAVNLLATLATEQSGDGTAEPSGTQSLPLSRIQEFIDRHLADPDLSPETIAAAHHISVRYLHKLFQDEDTTVGRWIQRRRLEECRRDLLHRVRGRRTIAAVAARWGFLSAPHFSRVFRAAYGMSPSEWRDTAGGRTPYADPSSTRARSGALVDQRPCTGGQLTAAPRS
ncbi:helix-turn-helix domain-containing protein [Streptomyces sp. NPDC086033]|uniref:helix-turn-helix domain-containing protein n=1 Tax=Streptomyces sp. NPDC086033 TaxID=3365747 RepID=UPI0037D18EEA